MKRKKKKKKKKFERGAFSLSLKNLSQTKTKQNLDGEE
jgi:hypothetical protein